MIKHEEYSMFLNDKSYGEAESCMTDCTENTRLLPWKLVNVADGWKKRENRRAVKHQFPEIVAPNEQAMKSLYKQRKAMTTVNKMKTI